MIEQNEPHDAIKLTDNILNEDNPFKYIGTGDILIEGGLFDNYNGQNIKDLLKEIIHVNEPFTDIIDDDLKSSMRTITIGDDIHIPSDDRIGIDAPK